MELLSLVVSWAYSSWTIQGASMIKRKYGTTFAVAFVAVMVIMGAFYLFVHSSSSTQPVSPSHVSVSVWPPWSWWSRATQASFAHRYVYVGLVIGALYAAIGHAMVGGGATLKVTDGPPLFAITSISAKFARDTENQGIIITVIGTKDAALTFGQAKLHVKGEQFWAAIGQTIPSAIVRLVQWTVLPITLCPSYMDATSVTSGTTDVSINVAIGTKQRGTAGVLHDTIRTQLNGLIAKGDPTLTLRFETAKTKWNDPSVEGLLFEWPIRVSTLLASLNGDRGENLWHMSSSSSSSSPSSVSNNDSKTSGVPTITKGDSEEKVPIIPSSSSSSSASPSSSQPTKPSSAMSKKAKSMNRSDASTSAAAAAAAALVPFVCTACTFVNTTNSNKCSVCDTVRDASPAPATASTATATPPSESSVSSSTGTSLANKNK